MKLPFQVYEIPLLKALDCLGGSAKVAEIYPVVEEIMRDQLAQNPEERGQYKHGEVIWKNKTQWAREYLKRKGQLDASQRGVWKITEAGRQRLNDFKRTGADPDEGLSILHGVPEENEEVGEVKPEERFDKLEQLQLHETGDILGVRGIVYEPINEQVVILLFAALCYDLGFMIEGIRAKFPDALLRRKNEKGRWISCKAEFEFRSSHFRDHKHDPTQCDIIICWEHDYLNCPLEVLSLKEVAKRYK